MRGVLATQLGFALALATFAFARPAGACSCAWPDTPIPGDGWTAAKNTRVWIPPKLAERYFRLHVYAEKRPEPEWDHEPPPQEFARAVVLVGPAGEPLEFEVTDIRVGSLGLFFVIIPRVELAIGAHELRPSAPPPYPGYRPVHTNFRFTVTDARIETPPAVPKVTVGEWQHFPQEKETMCSPTGLVTLNVEHKGWLLAYQIYDPKKKPDPNQIEYWITEAPSFVVGDGACSPYWRFDGGPALVRFGSIDLRGKFSGFSSPIPLDPPWPRRPMKSSFPPSEPPPHGCGCRTGSRSPEDALPGLVLLFSGLALGSRRRRGH